MNKLPIIIDFAKLKDICTMDFDGFKRYADRHDTAQYYFKDNGSNILAVAHLDSVSKCKHFETVKFELNGAGAWQRLIFSPTLDDRLGAYVILELLPSLGIVPDILLTDGEETANSSARYFTPPEGKQYHWIFSFDRRGSDVVMYDYQDEPTKKLMEDHKFVVGSGSYSDICELENLKCKGFNFGVGYEDYHSKFSYAIEGALAYQVRLFVDFWNTMKDTPLPHEPQPYDHSRGSYARLYRGAGNLVDIAAICKFCGANSTFHASKVCYVCRGELEVMREVYGVPPRLTYCESCDIPLHTLESFDSGMCYVCRNMESVRDAVGEPADDSDSVCHACLGCGEPVDQTTYFNQDGMCDPCYDYNLYQLQQPS
jgi:hypothetical protein